MTLASPSQSCRSPNRTGTFTSVLARWGLSRVRLRFRDRQHRRFGAYSRVAVPSGLTPSSLPKVVGGQRAIGRCGKRSVPRRRHADLGPTGVRPWRWCSPGRVAQAVVLTATPAAFVEVARITGWEVRLVFEAPDDAPIRREEPIDNPDR